MAPSGLQEPSEDTTNLEGLSRAIANDEILREKILKEGTLFSWPNKKTVGIINFCSMAQNATLLGYLIDIWCPQIAHPKTLYVPHARKQAGPCVGTRWLRAPLQGCFVAPARCESCECICLCLMTVYG